MKFLKLDDKEIIQQEIAKGKIFIYPTDTLYGLGCDANNKEAINRIKNIKKRENKPFLIMVPSKEWIKEHYQFNHEEELNKLPGPFSFIVKNNNETLGVRVPDCTMTKIIQGPFISTSVNLAGEAPALTLDDISNEIKEQIDYIIKSDKPLLGKPSEIWDLTQEEPKRLR